MAASLGSCRGQALRRPHVLRLESYVIPYAPILGRPPEYEATLPNMKKHPAPISCRKSFRLKWAVFVFAAHD